MGRTLPSAMQVFDGETARWGKFRRALRREDQEVFDELFLEARRHVAAMSYASSAVPMEAVLLAMLLEERRALRVLRTQVRRLEDASCAVLPAPAAPESAGPATSSLPPLSVSAGLSPRRT